MRRFIKLSLLSACCLCLLGLNGAYAQTISAKTGDTQLNCQFQHGTANYPCPDPSQCNFADSITYPLTLTWVDIKTAATATKECSLTLPSIFGNTGEVNFNCEGNTINLPSLSNYSGTIMNGVASCMKEHPKMDTGFTTCVKTVSQASFQDICTGILSDIKNPLGQ